MFFKVTVQNIRREVLLIVSHSARYSGWQYGKTHLPQDCHSRSLVLEIFTNIYGQNSNAIKSEEKILETKTSHEDLLISMSI
jgi:hypothetical protein